MWSGEEFGYVGDVGFYLFDEFECVLEGCGGFAWEAADDVCGYCDLGEGCFEFVYSGFEVLCGVESLHAFEDCVVAALHGQMHELEDSVVFECFN